MGVLAKLHPPLAGRNRGISGFQQVTNLPGSQLRVGHRSQFGHADKAPQPRLMKPSWGEWNSRSDYAMKSTHRLGNSRVMTRANAVLAAFVFSVCNCVVSPPLPAQSLPTAAAEKIGFSADP